VLADLLHPDFKTLRQKPRGLVELDYSNPIVRACGGDIRFCLYGYDNAIVDLAGKKGVLSGERIQSVVHTSKGSFPGNLSTDYVIDTSSTSVYTVIAAVGYQEGLDQADSIVELASQAGLTRDKGTLRYSTNASNLEKVTGDGDFAVAIVGDDDTNRYYFLDNQYLTSGSGGTFDGSRLEMNRSVGLGYILAVGAYLPPEVTYQLTQDPWQIFKPQEPSPFTKAFLNLTFSANTGSVDVTGVDPATDLTRLLSANVASLSVSGVDNAQIGGLTLRLDVGSMDVAGVNFSLQPSIGLVTGAVQVAGANAQITKFNALVQSFKRTVRVGPENRTIYIKD